MDTKKVTKKRNSPRSKDSSSAKNIAVYGSFILFCLILAGGAVMFGRSDKGQIDVSETIRESNVAAAQDAKERGVEPPAPVNTNPLSNLPNGGLTPRGENAAPISPSPQREAPQPAVESASTTDDTVSSTEDGSEDSENSDNTEENVDAEETESAPTEE